MATTTPPCCLRIPFTWDGTPTGTVATIPGTGHPTYVTAHTNPRAAVLLIHDLVGWTFPNLRLLADHYAREIDATVYVPDFFGGVVLPFAPILENRFADLGDLTAFWQANNRHAREPEIVAVARALRATYPKLGAVGFCYGGWAVFRLGAREFNDGGERLVDAVSAAHPTFLTKGDIDGVGVPVQLLAPERDAAYTDELKLYTFSVLLGRKDVSFDYQHMAGVEHGCLSRGDEREEGERDAMVRGKDAAVSWMRHWLHVQGA
ncbi:dienelactone hydrolase [Bombardia bombarda]|uniref:Dienelactone hydrolase n=1 Tax=Bombardia bombarda TaxID=252184 RepID=A0AA39XLW4_9PEZI|nr:dienelactone hydrolase [Bombardia bombarda]